jgi:hypothetical protein
VENKKGRISREVRLLWQKSSLATRLLSVISVLDDNQQLEHRGGKRFIVRANDMLTAFMELQRRYANPR